MEQLEQNLQPSFTPTNGSAIATRTASHSHRTGRGSIADGPTLGTRLDGTLPWRGGF